MRTARIEYVSRTGDVLEHVVEYDDVEPLIRRQHGRKESVPDRQAALRCRARDGFVRLDAEHVVLLAREIEEPAMRAADVEQPAAGGP